MAVVENPAAVVVIANKATGFERVANSHGREILEDVVRTAAVGFGFAEDVRQGVLLGVGVDDLDLINDEVACCENALALGVHD